jgi:uncharacterized protein YkwD
MSIENHQVDPLIYDEDIAREAQAYAEELAARGVLQHDPTTTYGENLAYAKY